MTFDTLRPRRRRLTGRLDPHAETGAETVELALVLPMFMLLALALIPIVEFFSASREVNRLADEAAVYATRASDNPERTSDGGACGDLTRRRSYGQVDSYARQTATVDIAAVDVLVQPPGTTDEPGFTGSSNAHPCLADPGSRVHVRVTGEFSIGPLADSINAVARLIGSESGIVPDRATLSATSAGYLE